MGFEGANVIFDTWVHPLMMGLEEHLLGMFRGDFEFQNGAAPSHLGKSGIRLQATDAPAAILTTPALPVEAPVPVDADRAPVAVPPVTAIWAPEAEKELSKIPFFVRGKARRNTERFAIEHAVPTITIETLYDAKAHFSR
jgi:light-independent protochlorophyllide reductase subunit B